MPGPRFPDEDETRRLEKEALTELIRETIRKEIKDNLSVEVTANWDRDANTTGHSIKIFWGKELITRDSTN